MNYWFCNNEGFFKYFFYNFCPCLKLKLCYATVEFCLFTAHYKHNFIFKSLTSEQIEIVGARGSFPHHPLYAALRVTTACNIIITLVRKMIKNKNPYIIIYCVHDISFNTSPRGHCWIICVVRFAFWKRAYDAPCWTKTKMYKRSRPGKRFDACAR